MTIGAALAVLIIGVILAAFVNATIGLIVVAIGIVGLIVAVLTAGRSTRVP